ncbi:mannose-1-phosphate guanylyltransferase/mannose-6-phosphate isomerase [Neomegalonema sp.]|uniref:mannose-1-phosphate guanylyltransferase/mannose-6-phosphate isomerase n=1 Tax=Neomegalonema sp. TaxID=2039713 RepID=UPI002602B690|nr:mannose-1-phosphate guanylyltransferase/mannose-6-phosphate isomerase [Neomegalonema sp.]MDD2869279.1 mannose-1-phosphate guanylyltransferase/mannose-6-phosphate isomerase [Neomegalonema sp.]
MASPILPVVLAGGQGTRLWPMSRSARPKQFLPLMGETSLFQDTLSRASPHDGRYGPALVLTNAEYRFLVAEQAQEIGAPLAAILLEPTARNTAAAIVAAAAHAVLRIDPEAVLHVLPSDHAIVADEGYWRAVDAAASAARSGFLVTFGVTPDRPETGYGYILCGEPLTPEGALKVARFVEKPDLARAEAMLAAGGHVWNSGMFMLKARVFLEEAGRLAPETFRAASLGVERATSDLDFVRIDEESFAAAPDISVDYAIFEKTDRASVLPVSFAWSDLGAWDAVWKARGKDARGNAASGPASFSEASGSLVISEKAHVVVQGLKDVAVIASEDAIFVGPLSETQKVGGIVARLRSRPETRALTEIHKTVYRPWGGYSSVLGGERFQVKRLFVKPGKKLSLQKHHHRSEHWIVVRGTAEVTVDGQTRLLTENESIYLPLGAVHRLANPGKILLELIEVQTGSYLGEDDIVRFEDMFGRV